MAIDGYKVMQSDDAFSFLEYIRDAPEAAARRFVEKALKAPRGLDADEGVGIWAWVASEVVAARYGQPSTDSRVSELAGVGARLKLDATSVRQALDVLAALETQSLLKRVFDDAGQARAWHDEIAELRARLSRAGDGKAAKPLPPRRAPASGATATSKGKGRTPSRKRANRPSKKQPRRTPR